MAAGHETCSRRSQSLTESDDGEDGRCIRLHAGCQPLLTSGKVVVLKLPALILAALLTLTSTLAAAPSPDIIEKTIQSVVHIQWQPDPSEDKWSKCSGFAIDLLHVLTATHCTSDDYSTTYWIDGEKVQAKLKRKDENLALLQLATAYKAGLKIAPKNPRRGEGMTLIGHALGSFLISLSGTVAGFDSRVIIDHTAVGGMSGGPIINEKGEVIGLLQAGNQTVSMATTPEDINRFLRGK